ncbi:hypothetical protein BaRGS_00036819, partial [Batillaria attramentaria]
LGTDVYLSCPEEWVEGADVTLTCKVDAVRVNNRTCSGQMLDLVDFQFVSSSGTDASPECQVKDYMTKACGDDGGSGSLNSRGCRCMELSDGTYVFEYVVKMDKARYDGGSWRCVPTCRDTHLDDPLTYKVEKTCTGISISPAKKPQEPTGTSASIHSSW